MGVRLRTFPLFGSVPVLEALPQWFFHHGFYTAARYTLIRATSVKACSGERQGNERLFDFDPRRFAA
jgi:hypothetical protein